MSPEKKLNQINVIVKILHLLKILKFFSKIIKSHIVIKHCAHYRYIECPTEISILRFYYYNAKINFFF